MICLCAGLLAVSAASPFVRAALDSTEADARHLSAALSVRETLTEADDFDQNGKIDAIDLSRLKAALMQPDTNGEMQEREIPVSEKVCKLIGRTLEKDGTTWLVQSGSAVECTVSGTSASVTLAGDGSVESEEKYRPRYGVFVDGELVADVLMSEAEQTVPLFEGTVARTAVVKVIHLSEANNGAVGVKRFTVESAQSAPVKPTAQKDLRIEFIGDSITCAYGVEADSQYTSFETATENFTKSYAYLTAQLLDADYSAVCYSGHGIISGYTSGDEPATDALVPDVYDLVGKPEDYAVSWDFETHQSDVVVINLGTNDDSYASKDLQTRGEEYKEGYAAFLEQVRALNPDAVIICTLGIMGCEELYPYLEEAVAASGDEKITCYQSPTQNAANGYGADWHPSAVTHEQNAYLLADKICTAIGREWSRVGIDMAADGKYDVTVNTEEGANAWPYFSDYDHSMSVNVTTGGTRAESIVFSVSGLSLPAGGYELAFSADVPEGMEIPYAVRSMTDPEKVYLEGVTDGQSALLPFEMAEADEQCEIVWFIGGKDSVNIVFRNITLFKRS